MKTHLLTKKRALISSVAMLLVAIIALGTATFAWFTKSTSTTAEGLNVKTIKSSELQISSSNHTWVDDGINYSQNDKVLKPASTANGTAWFQADAAKKTESTLATGTIRAASGKYVFKDQLNVKNAAAVGSKAMNVTIEVTGLSNDYGRVALVPAKADTPADGVAPMLEGASFTDHLFDNAGEKVDALTDAVGGTTPVQASATTTFTIQNLEPQTAKYFNLYVWFEGQDKQCYDTNSGQPIGNITINVTGESVETPEV